MTSFDKNAQQKRRFLTTLETAMLLRQSPRTITSWAITWQETGGAQGIRGIKLGRKWLFDEADILALIDPKRESRTPEASQPRRPA